MKVRQNTGQNELDEEMPPPNPLGVFIRSERNARGWTVRELAERAQVSHAAISDLELGKTIPQMYTLRRVADALGIGVDRVLAAWAEEPVPATDPDTELTRAINQHPTMHAIRKADMHAIHQKDIEDRRRDEDEGTGGSPARTPPRPIRPVTPPDVIAALGNVDDLQLPENQRILRELAEDDT